jgi:HSP20 family protein
MTLTDLVPWKKRKGDIRAAKEYDDMLGSFHREVDNLIERFFNGFGLGSLDSRELDTGEFLPRIDVKEDAKEIKVTAELPGMDEKDIDLTLSGDLLTIKGEKQQETEDKGKDYYRTERRYGSFRRVVPLSAEVDEGKAEADFKKGVLKIRLPKTAEAQKNRKRIEIKNA